MLCEITKPIPEGLQRGKFNKRKSIERLDQIIKLGGAVGEGYSVHSLGNRRSRKRAFLNRDKLKWVELDLDTRADAATYSYYGKLINKECKEKCIPSPYLGAIGWTFRNTKDRVWTVNTLIYLLVQRRTSEQFILNMKEVINILHERVNESEAKIKRLVQIIGEKDEKIASLNPEREIKRKTDAFNARMELFKQTEESLQKQIANIKKKEQQLEIEIKKLSKDLAITKKGKTDMERKYQVILNQKRSQETQYKNIQQRLVSKLNNACDSSLSNQNITLIGEIPLLETEKEKKRRIRKNPRQATRDSLGDFIEQQNRNHIVDLQKIIAENGVLNNQIDLIMQRFDDEESESSCTSTNVSLRYEYPENETCAGPSVYDFYYAKLKDIFAEHVPEAQDDITMLLESFPNKEHLVYEKVCCKFGITPVPEYTQVMSGRERVNLTDANVTRNGVLSVSIPNQKFKPKSDKKKRMQQHEINGYAQSPAWVDDNDMDDLSVELDKGWGFAVSQCVKRGSIRSTYSEFV